MRGRESSVSGVPRVTTSSKRTIWIAAAIGLLALGGCGGSTAPSDAGFEPRPSPGVRANPSAPPLALSLAGIELGYEHTCGLDSSGRAYCMGDNQYGQLGSGLPMRRCQSGQHPCSQTPLAVDGGITFVQLGLDQRHSCARSTDGSIYCWGFGEGGQLGDGLRASSQMPVRVQVAVRFRYLGRGQASGSLCAIAESGQLYCWGIGSDGQIGNGTVDVAPTPTAVASGLTFREAGSGQGFACGLAESGEIYCWGRNAYGKLGTGVAGASTVPALVAGGLQYSALAVGGQHACGLAVDGRAHCWGFSPSVGASAPVDGATTPQAVEGGRAFRSISAGYQHTCAALTTGVAYCWGRGAYGRLRSSHPPITVPAWSSMLTRR